MEILLAGYDFQCEKTPDSYPSLFILRAGSRLDKKVFFTAGIEPYPQLGGVKIRGRRYLLPVLRCSYL